MKQFAFKNLTVNIGKAGGLQQCFATQPTCAVACSALALSGINTGGINTGLITTLTTVVTGGLTGTRGCCGVNYSTLPSDVLFDPRDRLQGVIDPAELGLVRDQIDELTQLVDAREVQLRDQLAPQTLAEVEMLETHMQEALGDLQKMKKKFK